MQRNILTKAVLVALATLGASAVMAESSVTFYGTLDGSLTNIKTENSPRSTAAVPNFAPGSSSSVTGVSNGVMTQSYIGFRGVEDIGGGMEVSFKLESYLDLDTGATSSTDLTNSPLSGSTTYNARDKGGFWARNAYVGLKTNFGLFRLGQMDSLGYLSAERFSPFGASKLAPSRIFYATDFYTQGWSNAVAYFAKVGNFAGAAMYSAKETTNATNPGLGAKWASTVGYFDDQFSASLGYENNKSSVGTTLPATNESWFLNSFYDFGVAKLFAQYGFGKLDRAAVGAATPDVKSSGYQLGVTVPVGSKAKLLASYANGVLKLDSVVPSVDGLKTRDVKIFTVGGTYDLSKRTNLYAAFSTDTNDYQAPIPSGLLAGQIALFDTKVKTVAIGMRHSF